LRVSDGEREKARLPLFGAAWENRVSRPAVQCGGRHSWQEVRVSHRISEGA
jgi:hypothetical protein